MKEVNYDELNRIRELSGTLQESWEEKNRPMPFDERTIKVIDDHPATVSNPFSGESILLDPQEIAVYDVIMGASLTGKYDLVRKGSDWFRKYNPKAYMVLID